MSNANPSTDGPRALPQIRLVKHANQYLIMPPAAPAVGGSEPAADAAAPAFEPFALPPLPLSRASWAGTFCQTVWQRHRRCVGLILLVNARTRRWGYGFPAQRCTRTAACWSVARADFPEIGEDVYVAGSFQSRVFARGEDPRDAVPPADGLHVVVSLLRDGEQDVGAFVRADHRVRRIAADDIFRDDWSVTLEEVRDRLKFV